MKINIDADPQESGHRVHKLKSVDLKPGLTVLVGCNGYGKTTLLRQIKDFAFSNEYKCVSFEGYNSRDNDISNLAFYNKMESVAGLMFSSEGEQLTTRFGSRLQRVGYVINHFEKDDKPVLFIIFDGIDSGVSVNEFDDIDFVFHHIEKTCEEKNIEVYILVSTNNFELIRDNNCFDPYLCRYIDTKSINTYDNFRKYIIKTSNSLKKRVYKQH